MPTFNNLNQLFNHVKKQMTSVMKNEVAETVRDYEQKAIDREVYDAYNVIEGVHGEPYVYERRRDNGGLRSRKNMKEFTNDIPDGVELSIVNVTKGKDQNFDIAPLIEFGHGYGGRRYQYTSNRDGTAYQYLNPRPFTQATVDDLKRTNAHVDSLKDGLRKRGIKAT